MKRLKKILREIDELFGDTSVSQETTLDALKEIRDDLESKIGCIEADLERRDKEGGMNQQQACGYAAGDTVEAAHDITSGLHQSQVLATEGTRLLVLGPSGNALHPIAVAKEQDRHYIFAVSDSNLRRPA